MVIRKQNTSPCDQPPSSTTAAAAAGITRRKHRYPVDQAVDQDPRPEDSGVGCSGKSCRSCTAGVIADCVAVCCCPCAVVNFFTLTFLKLPWMMGRKCLGLGNNNKRKKKKKKLKNDDTEKDRSGISRKDEGVERKPENNLEEEVEKEEYSARFEAEKVWLELYKIDHLGFGRVSFTGLQSLE